MLPRGQNRAQERQQHSGNEEAGQSPARSGRAKRALDHRRARRGSGFLLQRPYLVGQVSDLP